MEDFRNPSSTVDFVISGYGTNLEETVAGYRFDVEGRVQRLWQTKVEQASFVCRWDNYLFTVTEADDYCIVYLLKRSNETYMIIDQKKLECGALCHIIYSPKHQILYGACYATGTIFGVQVVEERFREVIYSEIQQSPSGKALTRAHCVLLNAGEDKLLTVNIALDEILCYELIEGVPALRDRIAMPEGVGPRHAVYSADETLLYVITEYSNEIFVYQIAGKRLLQQISTLPADYQGMSNCSTLCITEDGRHLYAANRGADTIEQFSIDSEGRLEWKQDYSCGGKHPRHMLLTDKNELLIICNQFSNNVTAYAIDQSNGELVNKVMDLEYSSPSGIVQI